MKYSQFGKHGQLTFISLSSDITFHNLKIKKEIKKRRDIFQIITRSKIFIQLTRWIFDFVSFSFWMTLNQCTSFRLIDFVSFGHFVTFLHYRRIWDRILRITFPVFQLHAFQIFKYYIKIVSETLWSKTATHYCSLSRFIKVRPNPV